VSARRMHGFTLIEVVIAFAILGLALAALYGAFANALARTQHDAHFREGTMIVQSLLSRAGSELPSAQHTYRDKWNGYAYEVIQEPLGAPDSPSAFTQPTVRVTAKVWWTEGEKSRDIEISTVKLLSKAGP
jgi:general secretion pathway protein I